MHSQGLGQSKNSVSNLNSHPVRTNFRSALGLCCYYTHFPSPSAIIFILLSLQDQAPPHPRPGTPACTYLPTLCKHTNYPHTDPSAPDPTCLQLPVRPPSKWWMFACGHPDSGWLINNKQPYDKNQQAGGNIILYRIPCCFKMKELCQRRRVILFPPVMKKKNHIY